MLKKSVIIMILMSLLLMVVFLITLSWGTYTMSFSEVVMTLLGQGSKLQSTTIFDIRLPRLCVAMLVAICLSTAGCILQSVTRNELAEPGMIGINAGAALAVVLLISSGQKTYYSEIGDASLFVMPLIAMIGSFISGSLIYRLSYKKGVSPTRLILTGIGVNVGINAFISLYQLNMAQGDYNQVLTWINGSLWGSSWKFFYLILPLTLVFLGLTLWKVKILDVIDLGDELAIGLGVHVEKERKMLFFYATALAALATSVAGNLAFLGLLGPHLAKRLVGPVHRRLIPMASRLSVMIILLADSISRNVFSPIEIPVGTTIAIVGVPYFIYLMLKE